MQYRFATAVSIAAILLTAGAASAADKPAADAAKPAAQSAKPAEPAAKAQAAPKAAEGSKAKAAVPKAGADKAGAPAKAAKPKLVDVNTASREELKTLPGIGDAEADRIVKGRPYLTKSHLVTEKVLTESQFLAIKPSIRASQESGDPTEALKKKQQQKK